MFVCKSKTLANFLMENNLKCERVNEDKLNPHYMVFLFKKSNEWNRLMKLWSISRLKK